MYQWIEHDYFLSHCHISVEGYSKIKAYREEGELYLEDLNGNVIYKLTSVATEIDVTPYTVLKLRGGMVNGGFDRGYIKFIP